MTTSCRLLHIFFLILVLINCLCCFSQQHHQDSSSTSQTPPPSIPNPPHTSKTILDYINDGNVHDAYNALEENFWTSVRNPNNYNSGSGGELRPLSKRIEQKGAGLLYTTRYKLQADLDQMKYIISSKSYSKKEKDDSGIFDSKTKEYFTNKVIPIYEKVLKRIPDDIEELPHGPGLYPFTQEDINDGILDVYNKALYIPKLEINEDTTNESLFNPLLDIEKIQNEWVYGTNNKEEEEEEEDDDDDDNNKNIGTQKYPPGIIVIDNLLSNETITKIRKLLIESTIYYQTKLPKQYGSYVGAYIDDGLHNKILLELIVQLRQQILPKILKQHKFKYMWCYKYDSNTPSTEETDTTNNG